MKIYKTTKRIKEKVVRRRRKKRAFGKEGISDESKNDQRDKIPAMMAGKKALLSVEAVERYLEEQLGGERLS